jgi:hypothetical protein
LLLTTRAQLNDRSCIPVPQQGRNLVSKPVDTNPLSAMTDFFDHWVGKVAGAREKPERDREASIACQETNLRGLRMREGFQNIRTRSVALEQHLAEFRKRRDKRDDLDGELVESIVLQSPQTGR